MFFARVGFGLLGLKGCLETILQEYIGIIGIYIYIYT